MAASKYSVKYLAILIFICFIYNTLNKFFISVWVKLNLIITILIVIKYKDLITNMRIKKAIGELIGKTELSSYSMTKNYIPLRHSFS